MWLEAIQGCEGKQGIYGAEEDGGDEAAKFTSVCCIGKKKSIYALRRTFFQ